MKYQVPGPGSEFSASKRPVNPYQVHRVLAAMVTTTVAVTYTANRRHPTTEAVPWVQSNHRDPSGQPRLPKAKDGGGVPTGPSKGAPRPYHGLES